MNTRVHHVVFCVRPENQERAADFWRGLGMTFSEVPLVDEGIRVLLDWSSGIELVSPSEPEGTETARFRAFLEERVRAPIPWSSGRPTLRNLSPWLNSTVPTSSTGSIVKLVTSLSTRRSSRQSLGWQLLCSRPICPTDLSRARGPE